jgi:hypothetical protein
MLYPGYSDLGGYDNLWKSLIGQNDNLISNNIPGIEGSYQSAIDSPEGTPKLGQMDVSQPIPYDMDWTGMLAPVITDVMRGDWGTGAVKVLNPLYRKDEPIMSSLAPGISQLTGGKLGGK